MHGDLLRSIVYNLWAYDRRQGHWEDIVLYIRSIVVLYVGDIGRRTEIEVPIGELISIQTFQLEPSFTVMFIGRPASCKLC